MVRLMQLTISLGHSTQAVMTWQTTAQHRNTTRHNAHTHATFSSASSVGMAAERVNFLSVSRAIPDVLGVSSSLSLPLAVPEV